MKKTILIISFLLIVALAISAFSPAKAANYQQEATPTPTAGSGETCEATTTTGSGFSSAPQFVRIVVPVIGNANSFLLSHVVNPGSA